MNDLLLATATRQNLESVISAPPQALLICGPDGSGKFTLAERLSAQLLEVEPDKLTGQPHYHLVQKPAGKQEIPIESVREIIKKIQLKPVQSASKGTQRVVLIDQAHLLSPEAQNAVLKNIEEPPAATVFLLTALSENSVLPTIASRTQKLKVTAASQEEALRYFADNFREKSVKSAWQLSGGAAGLLMALLRDDAEHPLKQSVEAAKQLLKLNRYDRVLFLDNLSSDKAGLTQMLDALARVLAALSQSAISAGRDAQTAKILAARKQVNQAIAGLEKNSSPKLIAISLALSLPV